MQLEALRPRLQEKPSLRNATPSGYEWKRRGTQTCTYLGLGSQSYKGYSLDCEQLATSRGNMTKVETGSDSEGESPLRGLGDPHQELTRPVKKIKKKTVSRTMIDANARVL